MGPPDARNTQYVGLPSVEDQDDDIEAQSRHAIETSLRL